MKKKNEQTSELAFCFANGLLKFGKTLPKGSILLARGNGTSWRQGIEVLCRHSYDGKSLLIPGIPEADGEYESLDALERFVRVLAVRGYPDLRVK